MFDKNSSLVLWVSPDAVGGNGTFDNPFCDIESALKKAIPGTTIVLQSGDYDDDLTIQVSGLIDKPIRITADLDAKVIVNKCCWYFYDTSDLIISGITFKDTLNGAISVTGKCVRNRFEKLTFIDCGTAPRETCSIYFGGAGIENNLVIDCKFTRTIDKTNKNISIAIMLSDSANDTNNPIRQHMFAQNEISGYTHAIIAGSSDNCTVLGGHIISNNIISNCTSDAVVVKSSDTDISDNLIKDCEASAIRILNGQSVTIENNRIERCSTGVAVNGEGHSVLNNCIIDSSKNSILVCKEVDKISPAAENLIVHANTLINTSTPEIPAITCQENTSSILSNNLFHGYNEKNYTCTCADAPGHHVCTNNATTYEQCSNKSFKVVNPQFKSLKELNCETPLEYGAHGWMAESASIPKFVDASTESAHDVNDISEDDPQYISDEEALKKDNEIINAFFQSDSDDFFYDDDDDQEEDKYDHYADRSFHERDDV